MVRAGVLVVDKPRGPTSHDVVATIRRVFKTREVGHCGTLDPMATGVLVVAIGEATKLVPWLTAADKEYEATVRLGVETDSLDAEGSVLATRDLSSSLVQALEELGRGTVPSSIADAVARELARTEQLPPAISAIKIGGKRAYEIAREGGTPELAARPIEVKRLAVVGGGLDPEPHLKLVVEASKGFFVRALARDIAASLETVGHLTSLRRTRSGPFSAAEASPLDPAHLPGALLSLADGARRALPSSVLSSDGVRRAEQGQRVPASEISNPHSAPSAWLDESGELVAIGETIEDGTGRVLRGFPVSRLSAAPRP